MTLLAPAAVTKIAGPRSYARGLAYHADDRVELRSIDDTRAEAMVRGTMPYNVALWVEDGQLAWSCSCPVGEDGDLCKHCVAVACAVVEGAPVATRPSKKQTKQAARPQVDLQAYVDALDPAELAALVMEQVESDWKLRERLVARAAAASGHRRARLAEAPRHGVRPVPRLHRLPGGVGLGG